MPELKSIGRNVSLDSKRTHVKLKWNGYWFLRGNMVVEGLLKHLLYACWLGENNVTVVPDRVFYMRAKVLQNCHLDRH